MSHEVVSPRSPRVVSEWPFARTWLVWTAASTLALVLAMVFALAFIVLFRLNEDRDLSAVLFPTWFALSAGVQARILSHRLRGAGWWFVATGVGWLSLAPLAWAIQTWLPNDQFTLLTSATTALIVGITTGCAQWVVLRRQWRRAGWWPVVSALSGVILALAVGTAITGPLEFLLLAAIPAAATGLLVAWLFVDVPARPGRV